MSLKKTGKFTISSLALVSLVFSSQHALANNKIDQLEQKKGLLEENFNSSKSVISDYEIQLQNVENELETLENRIFSLEKQIVETDELISEKEKKIKEAQTEVDEIKALIDTKTEELGFKKSKLEQHIKFIYSNGKVKFLEILFRSNSLFEFINRYEKYNDITNDAKKLHDEILEQIDYIDEQKEMLEKKRDALENEKNDLVSIKNSQLEQKKIQDKLFNELEAKHEHIKNEKEEQEAAMKEINAEIKKMEEKIKEEQRRIQEEKKKNNTTVSPSITGGLGDGVLASPMKKGTYYISSHYGWRTHPITGKRKLHNGTDFAAPRNTPIYAMEDGFVLFSGPASGYGNWIVIRHDNGLYSGYGHMYANQLFVKAGERVQRGQKIAGVGSAGESTGNHLHFFVSTTGPYEGFNYANPLNYIKR